MLRKKNKFSETTHFFYRLILPFFDPLKLLIAFGKYPGFIKDLIVYSKKEKAESVSLINIAPYLFDKTSVSPFDAHYFYQDTWAFKKIYQSRVNDHIDVGSRVDFIGFLSVITKVTFVDIRPIETSLKNLKSVKGDILSLPFQNNSVKSLSCLHVAEHVGLGRYGDYIDPLGTKKACQELSRVLQKGGNLYFSVPVGNPKLYFNAHRVHSPQQIIDYFSNLELIEFSGIDDEKKFKENIDAGILSDSKYACGLFWFRKK